MKRGEKMKNESSQEFKILFAERLGQSMTMKNCTQEELAQAIGSKQTTIFRWLNGEYCPNLEMAMKCARYLDVKIDFLTGLENDSQTYTNEYIATKTGLSSNAIRNLITYKDRSFGLGELLKDDYYGLVVLSELVEYYRLFPDKDGNVIYKGDKMPLNYAKIIITHNITMAILKTREWSDESEEKFRSNKEIKKLIKEMKEE